MEGEIEDVRGAPSRSDHLTPNPAVFIFMHTTTTAVVATVPFGCPKFSWIPRLPSPTIAVGKDVALFWVLCLRL